MTVEIEYFGPEVKFPKPATVFGRIDNELRAKAGVTRDRYVQSVRDEIPRRTGRTAAATTARVKAIDGGFEIRLSNRTNAHHLRFLQTGTGQHGPTRRKIPIGNRGWLMQGSKKVRPTGKGMRSQDTIRKMLKAPWETVIPKAVRDMREMWIEAAKDVYKDWLV